MPGSSFKACVPIEWSPRLYMTLVRGLPGTRKFHRRTVEAMRLRCTNRTVVHRTTPFLLGMLNQVLSLSPLLMFKSLFVLIGVHVKRLVAVETEEMRTARLQRRRRTRLSARRL